MLGLIALGVCFGLVGAWVLYMFLLEHGTKYGYNRAILVRKHMNLGIPVTDIDKLPIGAHVITIEHNTDHWCEHGEIGRTADGVSVINVYDALYDGTQHDVFLDKDYSNYRNLKKLVK